MGKVKFPSFQLRNLFKREQYDPTKFKTINDDWDETTSGSGNANSNISATGVYQNSDLPLEQQINLIKQRLEMFDKTLPVIKNGDAK